MRLPLKPLLFTAPGRKQLWDRWLKLSDTEHLEYNAIADARNTDIEKKSILDARCSGRREDAPGSSGDGQLVAYEAPCGQIVPLPAATPDGMIPFGHGAMHLLVSIESEPTNTMGPDFLLTFFVSIQRGPTPPTPTPTPRQQSKQHPHCPCFHRSTFLTDKKVVC